ncbi:Sdc1p PWA37_000295 [Arxiozyma heterogenica]|uniref:COMPASS component SDC1 n=1 Tax=Arxiozyma heterogenica TaxID=278026 RepID=A0AAN7WK44_9SACH|nr:hypothetical protein RI543_004115 [Kazachstania heterogenica]
MDDEIKSDNTPITTNPNNNNNSNDNNINNDKQEHNLPTLSTYSPSPVTETLKNEELSLEATEPSLKAYPQTTSSKSLGDIGGGSYTRRYLNDKVTPVLLEGMRRIAVEKPDNPLRVLGEYLIAESEKQK